jgi:hypothetical protein
MLAPLPPNEASKELERKMSRFSLSVCALARAFSAVEAGATADCLPFPFCLLALGLYSSSDEPSSATLLSMVGHKYMRVEVYQTNVLPMFKYSSQSYPRR